jgi:hypothetical protein
MHEETRMHATHILFSAMVFIALASTINIAHSTVAVGLTPASVILGGESGQEVYWDFIVFDVGDEAVNVTISTVGAIAPFSYPNITTLIVQPEPKPFTSPPRNGQKVRIFLKTPHVDKSTTYMGGVSVLGGALSVIATLSFVAFPTRFEIAEYVPYVVLVGSLVAAVFLVLRLVRLLRIRKEWVQSNISF